jgi:hypothetical protein
MTELPQAPWQQLSVDFCGPSGDMLFVVIDKYLRYPEVEVVRSTSANTVIPKFDRILPTHGIPAEIKCDSGLLFQSHPFAQFAQYMGFHYRKITPQWPILSLNGLCEQFRKHSALSTSLKTRIGIFLRNYSATPHGVHHRSFPCRAPLWN